MSTNSEDNKFDVMDLGNDVQGIQNQIDNLKTFVNELQAKILEIEVSNHVCHLKHSHDAAQKMLDAFDRNMVHREEHVNNMIKKSVNNALHNQLEGFVNKKIYRMIRKMFKHYEKQEESK